MFSAEIITKDCTKKIKQFENYNLREIDEDSVIKIYRCRQHLVSITSNYEIECNNIEIDNSVWLDEIKKTCLER